MLKKIWVSPVWSQVIAATIIAVGATVVTHVMGWWPKIAAIASGIVALSAASTPIPNWLLVPISLLASFGVFVLFVLLFRRTGPHWRDYCQTTLFGVVWRWRYSSYDNSINGLTPFCAGCDMQVFPEHDRYNPAKTDFAAITAPTALASTAA